jgi:hypothetical protein
MGLGNGDLIAIPSTSKLNYGLLTKLAFLLSACICKAR